MATERYDKRIDRDEDHDYYKKYAGILLPKVKGIVLDLGCGQGWLTKEIAKQPKVELVQAYDKFTKQPKENKDTKIAYYEADLTNFEIIDKYDTIISTEFIEHITRKDLERLLPQIKKGLKENGHFLGSTPNCDTHTGNPYHLQEYYVEALKDLFAKYGLKGEFYLPYPHLMVWDVWLQS